MNNNSCLITVPFYCYDEDYDLEVEVEEQYRDAEVTIHTNLVNCYIDLDDGVRLYGLHKKLPRISDDVKEILGDKRPWTLCPSDELNKMIKALPKDKINVTIRDIFVDSYEPQIIYICFNMGALLQISKTVSCDPIIQGEYGCFIHNDPVITAANTPIRNFNTEERKETKNTMMDNMLNKMRFGKAGKDYSLTMFGTIAFKNKTYINGEIQEVEGMTMPFDMIFAVPTQVIKAGDLIERDTNNVIYITKVEDDGAYQGISLTSGTVIDYVPKTYFGLKMYTKIVNPLIGGFNFGANDSLNGNAMMNMIMMQSLLGNDSSCNSNGSDSKMLMLMMMCGANNPFVNMFGMNSMAAAGTKNEK